LICTCSTAVSAPDASGVADPERIYGLHTVGHVLTHHPERALCLWVQETVDSPRVSAVVELALRHGVARQIVPGRTLDKLTANARHQGVVLEVQALPRYRERDLDELVAACPAVPLILALDGIQDPQNLGACLRAAGAAGVDVVISPGQRGSPMTSTARKVASGGAESIPIVGEGNLASLLRRLQNLGVWLVGLDAEADEHLFDVDLTGPVCLVLGAEDVGLRSLTRKTCDFLARLPMGGRVESYNVGVAAGIALYEAQRQRLKKKGTEAI
jgi:23S rRNA (guanosine2251-2'-O)-methyltransferase